MSTENIKEQDSTQTNDQDIKSQLDTVTKELNDYKQQFEAVKSKADELLSEAKKAKQLKREAELKAQQEAEDKARKEGDYKQLLESYEKKLKEEQEKFLQLKHGIDQEKINNTALKLAAELADGPNAELLSDFIARRLASTEEGIKVKDNNGQLSVSSLEELKQEFLNSDKYKALLRGSKATGGGATGAGNSVADIKEIKRSDFDSLPQYKKDKFIASGGKVVN